MPPNKRVACMKPRILPPSVLCRLILEYGVVETTAEVEVRRTANGYSVVWRMEEIQPRGVDLAHPGPAKRPFFASPALPYATGLREDGGRGRGTESRPALFLYCSVA